MIYGSSLENKLGDVHKIIRIPEETGGIQQKVGHSNCGFRNADYRTKNQRRQDHTASRKGKTEALDITYVLMYGRS